MRLYITDAQVPELAAFPPLARRVLRQSAFRQMFVTRPLLRWLPNGLCAFGVLLGTLTIEALPRSVFTWGHGLIRSLIPTGFVVLLACLGGFIGSQSLVHHSRMYLRRLISPNGNATHPTA